ncbi:Acyl-CoA dehydrogenase [Parafrankia irregularis]|uniref:Acyl-CoA dehydrogenase n=1 Tax=Parafrankia irregularis TaxID=795642 RepID=A0A0S4QQF9_9ACTN|nr:MULTISPECIES: acyl-CoA dehydrogenase family protein [Parafrankia]MBE3201731.1 acyl-CoA dehydrogenase family protein [Parafrankia sp. CH37]CUU57481.1 Acyl-CoA dehydrogenase [Parafrankia irregularis]
MSVRLLAAATAEQGMLVDTTVRFIEDTLPLTGVRALAESTEPVGAAYIADAASLGWFGMLVDERHGGGSASGIGLVDAAAVAAERGATLQPGPFVGTNVVAHALSVAASPTGDLVSAGQMSAGPVSADTVSGEAGPHTDLLARLVAGQAVATWVAGAVGGLTPGAGEVTIRSATDAPGGGSALDGYVLDGEVRHVPDALGCDVLLVTGNGTDGLTQVIVDTTAPGVEIRALSGLDITRRTCSVRLSGVHVPAGALVGTPGTATEDLFARQTQVAAVLAAAESVGAMHRDFELAVEYARARIAFGRPIGSFQAIKHLLADTSLSLEMAKGLVTAAAEALGGGAPDGAELAHAAKAFVAEHGITLTHACFQVFGGIGYTWEHDHHLFMRRLAADAVTYGCAQWHRARLAERIGGVG